MAATASWRPLPIYNVLPEETTQVAIRDTRVGTKCDKLSGTGATGTYY